MWSSTQIGTKPEFHRSLIKALPRLAWLTSTAAFLDLPYPHSDLEASPGRPPPLPAMFHKHLLPPSILLLIDSVSPFRL